jgi:uncharacterized protein YkwD
MGLCRHNYVYSQGHFFCTKCRKRTYGKSHKKRQVKKIGIGISAVLIVGIIGFLFLNGVFEINTKNLDKSIQDIPQNIMNTAQTTRDIATETSAKLQETTFEQIELPKYEPSKQYTLTELKQIALDDINKYRKEQGLRIITLGNAKSSQLYASELLIEGCIHHVSDRGEGPMLRYKNNNDHMYLISENIGGGSGTNWETPDESIINSNYRMMFDDADSNWGHKYNILDPNHSSVSIGIAYDDTRLIMVQDFEQTLQSGWQYDPSSFMKEPVDQRFCW